MQETQRILIECKNSPHCNQPYVKEACRQLFWARDEIVNLRRKVTELEQKVVESNHRNLDLQYIVDSDTLIMEKQKAALIEERARALWFNGTDPSNAPNLDWKTPPNDISKSVRWSWEVQAKKQLANEYPEIFAVNKRLQEIE